MVGPLFTAFALIACGRIEVPPAPVQPLPTPEIRGTVRDEGEADRKTRRR
jgi:hypothetical protein